ncbi:hypothetical protein Anacy_1358 [Anabaena cylindrica PCC 7122]|uniref:Uncharacterized protein n=1 Tax=Anabaena cylindrica (strain ATCC 27899 / PCC 7122) TaxID=272123 RepID=K9ZCC3_ANACC|nr:hypothetical protein Anacy_1358 [Anabaena cylindrica PCC 7122]BAY06169.1 hypothetical protein NIES19_54520 [Anabaena cylindrica PCC 7122]
MAIPKLMKYTPPALSRTLPLVRATVYTQVLFKIKSAVRNRNYTGKTPSDSPVPYGGSPAVGNGLTTSVG